MKYLPILLLTLLLSCGPKEPISTEQTNNPNIKAELLFEVDGCKVYRFYDKRFVYFTTCQGSTSASYETSDGKHTETYYDDVLTAVRTPEIVQQTGGK